MKHYAMFCDVIVLHTTALSRGALEEAYIITFLETGAAIALCHIGRSILLASCWNASCTGE